MPDANQDQLYREFISVATDFVAISKGVTGAVGDLTNIANGAPVAGGKPSSSASSSSAESAGGGFLDTLGSTAKSIGENALGAVPLIRGILSLFGGGDDSPEPPQLSKFLLPASIQFEAADTADGIRNVDYNQSFSPRPFGGASTSDAPSAATPSQVTVNVQAMDARSFLDRSSDIAAAVREAILNSSSLNDVVTEL